MAGWNAVEPRVLRLQQMLDAVSAVKGMAIKAANLIYTAMQVNDVVASRALVEPVHVLGNDQVDSAALFQLCQCKMCRIGVCIPHDWPAEPRASPIALLRNVITNKRLFLYGVCVQPGALLIAIGGYTGLVADARPRQDH